MSCTQSITLGCCDDDPVLSPQAYAYLGLQAELPGSALGTLAEVQALVAAMRRFVSRYPVPSIATGGSEVIYLLYSAGTNTASPLPAAQWNGFGLTDPGFGSFNGVSAFRASYFAGDSVRPSAWTVQVSRTLTNAHKTNPFPGFFAAEFPGCLWGKAGAVRTCIIGRATGSVSQPFDAGQSGWAYRAIDQGASVLYETTGADEQSLTSADWALLPSGGRNLTRLQAWSFRSAVLGNAAGPSCCDLSPL